MSIPWYKGDLPALTTEQMIEVDRAMIEDYHILLIQMMENAGRCLAQLARERFLDGSPHGKRILVLTGPGGNGGGALVAARRLYNYGAEVQIVLSAPESTFKPIPAHQLDITQQMDIPIHDGVIPNDFNPTLIIDGLIGYSLSGSPREPARSLINEANANSAAVLALDAPSGIDTTTGTAYDPSIKATATLTLALPKAGLLTAGIDAQVGELYLADISVPPSLYAGLGIDLPAIFAENDILRLR